MIIRFFNRKLIESRTATDEKIRILSELDQIFNTAASAMRVVDREYNVSRVNQAFLDLVGVTKDECVGKKCYDLFAGSVCHTTGCTLKKVIEGEKRVEYEITKQCRNGRSVPCIVVATPFRSIDGEIIGIVEDFRDITRQKMAEEEIRYQATHDPLTGLANRMFFNNQLSVLIMEMYRSRQKLCVLFLDLDRFKQINDSYGHSVGDKLLVEASKRIASCVRKQDIVARLGGDEFTLVLPQISSREDVMKIAGKIVGALKYPCVIEAHRISISTSIGIAVYPDDGEDAEELMKHADWAMYKSKETGNNFEFYRLEKPDSVSTVSVMN